MDLVEFLRARLDEDYGSVVTGDCRCGEGEYRADCPDRIAAEIEAKRRLVDMHQPYTLSDEEGDVTVCAVCEYAGDRSPESYPCATLRVLSLPYADHPDCQEDWRI